MAEQEDRLVRASDVAKLLGVLGRSDDEAQRAVEHLPDATPPPEGNAEDERPGSIAAQVAAGQTGAIPPFKTLWDGEGVEASAQQKARAKIAAAADEAGGAGLLA